MNNQADISIIIVSWNVCELLRNCLNSIYSNVNHLKFEIIVVDNNSFDNTVKTIKNEFPNIILIENKSNVGFAKANNQGINIAQGEFILFLNPDTLVKNKALFKMYLEFKKDKNVGLLGPKVIFPTGEIQFPCARKLPSLTYKLLCTSFRFHQIPFIGVKINKLLSYPYDYQKSQYVEAISGAVMLTKNHIIAEVGGFGENFIHTGEDTELCYRISKNGYQIKYIHDVEIIHLVGQSTKKAKVNTEINSALSVEKYFLFTGSNLKAKSYKFITIFIETPISIIISFLKWLLKKNSSEEFKETLQISKGKLLWKQIEN